LTSTPTPGLEVFADVWCPFAHVGLRLVRARLQDLLGANGVSLRVRAWPLELVNGRPLDPQTTAHHVADLRAQLGNGWFAGFDPSAFPDTTLPALAVAAAAYRSGRAVGERVSMALRDALFEEGRNVADPEVLLAIADQHGVMVEPVDQQAVLADWRDGQLRSVKGSPHFFCGRTGMFCPSLTIERQRGGALRIAPDRERLERFIDQCFGSNGTCVSSRSAEASSR